MAKSGEIKGLNKLLKDLQNLGVEGQRAIAETTGANAKEIEANAKTYAPIDTGKLRQSISSFEKDKLTWIIRANATGNAPYAAYMEFGTGGLVEVPDELKEIAIRFKGKGVKKIDLRPQPYLYPAFVKGRLQYIKDLKEDLKRLTKKI
jgi:HK97 gp10 family phage protein